MNSTVLWISHSTAGQHCLCVWWVRAAPPWLTTHLPHDTYCGPASTATLAYLAQASLFHVSSQILCHMWLVDTGLWRSVLVVVVCWGIILARLRQPFLSLHSSHATPAPLMSCVLWLWPWRNLLGTWVSILSIHCCCQEHMHGGARVGVLVLGGWQAAVFYGNCATH